jgi:rieske iron-sulfur protein
MHTRRDAVALGTATLVAGSCSFGEAFFVGEALAQGANERPREGDVFVSIEGGADAAPIEPKDIVSGRAPTLAWPLDPAARIVRNGSRLNKVLLLRLDPSVLTAATRDRAADGIVAYTAICPHTGCDVTGWIADQAILECPCHSSLYNPRDGGAVMGGPAPRPLPALPLKLQDGKVTVARPFTSRVGFTQG